MDLKDLCLISNTCTSWRVYCKIHGTTSDHLIPYNSPFISSLFYTDNDFLKLANNYDYYMQQKLEFVEDEHIQRYGPVPYVLSKLDDIYIHWIHQGVGSEHLIKNKFYGRYELGKNNEKVFIVSISELFDCKTYPLIEKYIDNFIKIPHKTIFLTNREKDIFEDENHICYYVDKWKDFSLDYRTQYNHLLWKDHFMLAADIFYDLLNDKFIKNKTIY